MTSPMGYQEILTDIKAELAAFDCVGQVAAYIPELARVAPDKWGMHLTCTDQEKYAFGDAHEKFSIQSISKVFMLALAMQLEGDAIWERVDVEPSGNPFNSLVQLEYEAGIPRNPLINSGALVVTDILLSHLAHPKSDFLAFLRHMCGFSQIDYNEAVAASELACGFRNAALANLLKDFGNLHNSVDAVLDFYVHLCSLEMSCEELAGGFLPFVTGGLNLTGDRVLHPRQAKRINAIMQTCGFYDEAGEFAFRVGLPGKSGVGGGIVAVHPGQYAVAVWSPPLNPKGNSERGMKALELLTTKTGLSIF